MLCVADAGRTYRGSGNCWCSCGRKLAAADEMTTHADLEPVGGAGDLQAEADMGAGAARSLAAADAADSLNKADNCVCTGRYGRTIRYPGNGCNCWISCSG
jgi:hypothetical protein